MSEIPTIQSSTWYRTPFGRHVIGSEPPYVSISLFVSRQRDDRRRALAELAGLSLPD